MRIWITTLIFIIGYTLGMLVSTKVCAAELQVAAGQSFWHAEGQPTYTLSYFPSERVELFVGNISRFDNQSIRVVGGEYDICNGVKWSCGLGIAHINDLTPSNGTHSNFSLSVTYAFTKNFFGRVRHFSHGAGVGVKRDLANAGWNLAEAGVLF